MRFRGCTTLLRANKEAPRERFHLRAAGLSGGCGTSRTHRPQTRRGALCKFFSIFTADSRAKSRRDESIEIRRIIGRFRTGPATGAKSSGVELRRDRCRRIGTGRNHRPTARHGRCGRSRRAQLHRRRAAHRRPPPHDHRRDGRRTAARRHPPTGGGTARGAFEHFARRLSDPRPLAPNERHDRQLWRTALVADRDGRARRLAALRRPRIHQDEMLFRKAHRRAGSDRKADKGTSVRTRPRIGGAGLHLVGLRHGRRDQSRTRRIGLYGLPYRGGAGGRNARNLDGRRRLHDGRSAGDQRRIRHRPAEFRGGDGAVQFRREGGLSAYDLSGLPPQHPHRHQEYLQSRSARHLHLA